MKLQCTISIIFECFRHFFSSFASQLYTQVTSLLEAFFKFVYYCFSRRSKHQAFDRNAYSPPPQEKKFKTVLNPLAVMNHGAVGCARAIFFQAESKNG